MPTTTQTLAVETRERNEMVEITDRLADLVRRSEVKVGMVVVYVPHTTAAVTINENADPDVKRDVLAKLSALAPKEEPYYRHGEGNSDSHVKSILTGQTVTLLIDRGELVLGQWQGVYFMEFDGPRSRRVVVRIVDQGRPSLN